MQPSRFITTLSQQFSTLAQRVQEAKSTLVAQSRFDRRLFHSRGNRLEDYLDECGETLQKLSQAAGHNQTEQVAWLAPRLVDQMTALARELATLELRNNLPSAPEPVDDYSRLAEHQDYERRLKGMIQDRESLLISCNDMARAQQLQQEIAALEGRLTRCRQALARIERKIEKRENGL